MAVNIGQEKKKRLAGNICKLKAMLKLFERYLIVQGKENTEGNLRDSRITQRSDSLSQGEYQKIFLIF